MIQETLDVTSEIAFKQAAYLLRDAEHRDDIGLDPTGRVTIADGWRRLAESLAAWEQQREDYGIVRQSTLDDGRTDTHTFDPLPRDHWQRCRICGEERDKGQHV